MSDLDMVDHAIRLEAEIDRLEAKVGRVTEERDHQTRRNVELFAEVARLRAALDEAENALLDYVPRLEAYGHTLGYGRGVLRKIREALNDE